MLQAYLSNDNQNVKKLINRCCIAGKCGTLAWMGWMQEKNVFVRKSADVFI